MTDEKDDVSTGTATPDAPSAPKDFIRAMVAEDVRTGRFGRPIMTRFPPEPNGYLHVGHAKSICLNFGIAEETEGACYNLRFDDTNPTTEDMRYAEAIQRDIRWLGFDWEHRLYFASDYFEKLYGFAVRLIEKGKAYVDSLSEEEIRAYRGTVTEPGRDSPHRSRSVDENLDLFARMRDGEFPDGAHVLRAKIDMASANMIMRDPLLYRIRHAHHYRTGDQWCIYPMYDFAHCLSDAIEGITHSLCSLEFKDNRDLYDWILRETDHVRPPEQTEFARLNLEHTVMSKRKLIQLVEQKHVAGWDDPRMPTLAGLRRRGVTPKAIRTFCNMVGVARVDNRVDLGKLEYAIRDDLNRQVPRVMCVVRPLKVVLDNYPENEVEELEASYYPHDVPKEGSRVVPFSRVLYIERDDFHEAPPRDYYRLAPGREVRLRYAYFIKCVDVVKDPGSGEIVEVHCTYDPASRGGQSPDGRKVKGTIHWVSAAHSLPVEIRLYDRLFTAVEPEAAVEERGLDAALNPTSLEIVEESRIEPSVADDPPGSRYQFERQGYFCSDPVDSTSAQLVFNRTVELRDTWAKRSTRPAGTEGRRPPRTASKPRTPKSKRRSGPVPERALTPEQTAMHERFVGELGVPSNDARVLVADSAVAEFYEDAIAVSHHPRAVANWVVNEVLREFKDAGFSKLPFTGGQLGALVDLTEDGAISRNIAKVVFAEMVREGGDPSEIVERKGISEIENPDELAPLVERVLEANEEKVSAYRDGRSGLFGFFVGQVMKESGGRANPETVKSVLRSRLAAK